MKHAISLATGARLQHLLRRAFVSENKTKHPCRDRQTCASATSWESMLYIGISDPENDATQAEIMAMHVEMLCHWLAGMDEIPEHHRALPWRAVVCVHERRFASFLTSLRAEWELIQKIDKLEKKSSVYKQMVHTRWQPVREMLIEAEQLSGVGCILSFCGLGLRA